MVLNAPPRAETTTLSITLGNQGQKLPLVRPSPQRIALRMPDRTSALTHPPHFLLPSPAVRSGTATGRRSRAANDRATARTAPATSPTRRESGLRPRPRMRRRPPHLPCYCKFRDLPASRVRSRFFALAFPLPAPPRRSPDARYATHPPVRLSAHLLLLLLCHAHARVSPSPSSSTNSRKARPEAASLFLFHAPQPRVCAHCQHLRPLWPRSVPTSSKSLT